MANCLGEVEFCGFQGREDMPYFSQMQLSFKGLQRHLTVSLAAYKTLGIPERIVYLIPEGAFAFIFPGMFSFQDSWGC